MTLSAVYGPGKFGLSFELFPPKTPQGVANLFQHVARLIGFDPSFITCTYGAGGSTQELTLEIVARVHREFNIPVATHRHAWAGRSRNCESICNRRAS